jgi:hypothetical protein
VRELVAFDFPAELIARFFARLLAVAPRVETGALELRQRQHGL